MIRPGRSASITVSEPTLNVLLASLLERKGLKQAVGEVVSQSGAFRPDVWMRVGGIRVILEGKFSGSGVEARLERQKQIHSIYAAELGGMTGIRLLRFDMKGGEIPQWTDAIVERRDNLDRYLLNKDIHCRRFWHPVHTQLPYFEPDDAFPNSTKLMPKAIWLPSAFTLSDEDVHLVCQSIRQFIQDEKD